MRQAALGALVALAILVTAAPASAASITLLKPAARATVVFRPGMQLAFSARVDAADCVQPYVARLDIVGGIFSGWVPFAQTTGQFPREVLAFVDPGRRPVTYRWRGRLPCGHRDGTVEMILTPERTLTILPRGSCVVPRVVGLTVARAKAVLRAAHCVLGRTTTVPAAAPRRGRVVRQTPAPGKATAARVTLVAGR